MPEPCLSVLSVQSVVLFRLRENRRFACPKRERNNRQVNSRNLFAEVIRNSFTLPEAVRLTRLLFYLRIKV